MLNKTNSFYSFFLFLMCWSVVQTTQAQEGDLTFQHLDIDNGLSENTNAFLYKDSKAFVWIGSMNGLNRFDGHSIKQYLPSAAPHNLLEGDIQSNFFEDKKTNLWFSTAHALHCYVRQYDNFDTFRISEINHRTSMVFYHVFYADAAERLWIKVEKADNQSGKGETFIYIFDPKIKQFWYVAAIMPANRCYALTDNAKNVTSITTSSYEKDLWRYTIKNNQIQQKQKVTLFDFPIINGQADLSNLDLLWFATDKGLLRYNAQTLQTTLFRDAEKTFCKGQDVALSNDQHYIYVSTLGQGVWLFDKQKECFIKHYRHEALNPNSLVDNQINTLYLDNDDNLWLSHWGKGLDYTNLHKACFQSPQALRAISNNEQSLTISNLLEDNEGNIWIGTREKGVFVLEKNTHRLLRPTNEIGNNNSSVDINSLCKDNEGNIWILSNLSNIQVYTTTHQLLSYKNHSYKTFWNYSRYESGLLLSTINNEWFSVSIKNNQITLNAKTDIPQGIALFKEEGSPYLYVGRSNTTISIYKKDPQTAQYTSFVKNIDNSDAIYNWYKDPSNPYLWMCTAQGLLRIQTNNLDVVAIGAQNGLKKRMLVANILKDKEGMYWLSTNDGLYQWDMEKKTSRHFTTADGLCSNDLSYYRSQSLGTSDGTIWVATTKGVNYFQPNQIKINRFLPKTEIIDFKINDQPYTEQNPTELQRITLPYTQNTLEFSFVSLEYTNNAKNQYQYILEGLDKNWVNAENRNYVRYAALPFGDYTLKLKSCNSDGLCNETPRELHICILTPWYFRWWAILLYVLSFGASVYAFIQYQAHKIKKEATIKQKQIQQEATFAQELNNAKMDALRSRLDPHFIFNALNSIKEYVLEQDTLRANNMINQFIRLMRALVETKDNEIALKAELDMLEQYLFLEGERFKGKLEYRIYVEDGVEIDYILIPALTIQPFVENAIKHGIQPKVGKGQLSVLVRMIPPSNVLITIEDDGVGRTQAEQNKRTKETHKSSGIDLVKQRLSLFYARKVPKSYTITYTDLHNHVSEALGTKVEILLDL